MKIVIVGGGIIGVSTAYYLAKRNIACTVIERTGIACAASGKAGGFLAKTWCDSYEVGPLARASFEMHMELMKDFETNCDYRKVSTLSVQVDGASKSKNKSEEVDWLDGPVSKISLMETAENSAQVHPYKLTNLLMQQAITLTNQATKVLSDTVVGIEYSATTPPSVIGVKLASGSVLEADRVVIAMGPWCGKVKEWFPKGSFANIRGHRAHSIVMQNMETDMVNPTQSKHSLPGPQCLFLNYKTDKGREDPEIYPRPDGTVYMCGLGDDPELPESADQVTVDKNRISRLRQMAYTTVSWLEDYELKTEQACFLPMSPDSLPVIGPIPGVQGAFVATGHSCWGILNAPATGKAMAELIVDGKCSFLDMKPFSPSRFAK